ncbi:hypothetical protein Tco_1423606 [Tanacetum coccineum]
MVQTRQPNNPPDVTEIISQQLQNIIPNIVTQVTNNLNNGNGNRNGGGNNGCTYKGFVACRPRDFNGTSDAANAMAWNNFKALLTTALCPSNEIEKLEGEFWNHSMVGADHAGYTDRFIILAKLFHIGTPESKRVTRYINGMPISDSWNALSQFFSHPQHSTMIKKLILTAGIQTDEAVCSGTLAKASEKMKEMDEANKSESVGKDEKKAKGG